MTRRKSKPEHVSQTRWRRAFKPPTEIGEKIVWTSEEEEEKSEKSSVETKIEALTRVVNQLESTIEDVKLVIDKLIDDHYEARRRKRSPKRV